LGGLWGGKRRGWGSQIKTLKKKTPPLSKRPDRGGEERDKGGMINVKRTKKSRETISTKKIELERRRTQKKFWGSKKKKKTSEGGKEGKKRGRKKARGEGA